MAFDLDDQDEIHLQPEQGKSPEERARRSHFLPPVDEANEKKPFQFPLPALFVLTGFCALGLMASHWSNQTIFAGVLGVPALYATWILCVDPPESWQMQTACWGLLLSYALACLVALIG